MSRSNAIDVKCAAGRSSHFPLHPSRTRPGMYDSYATGPYVSPSGFALSQRPFVWIRSRISPEASAVTPGHGLRYLPLGSCSTGKFPHGASAVTILLGADHARVADVDHVRALDVEPDPEAGEEDRRPQQHPDGPARRTRRAAVPDADPRPAQHHPDQQRIEERHRREDVAVIEEPQRRRRRQEEEQVEIAERERAAPVAEPEQEDGAERSPDPRVVDRRPAERARRSARHSPGDLRPRPRLTHRTRRILHRALGDLAGGAPPDLDRPVARLPVVGDLVAPALVRVAREPVLDLRVALEDLERRLLVQERARPGGNERRLDEMPFAVEHGAGRRRRRRGERRRGERGDGKRSEGDGEETPHARQATYDFARRNDQSLFPTKLSGVTMMIATACARSLPRPP